MAAGMAIITTKDTGCAEVVGDAGLLVESRNPVAIKEALSKLINNPDLCRKLGQAARSRVEENFSWSAITKRYIDIYSKFVEG
jgi:glycosyltransferase involved in cell wall biosynthesis